MAVKLPELTSIMSPARKQWAEQQSKLIADRKAARFAAKMALTGEPEVEPLVEEAASDAPIIVENTPNAGLVMKFIKLMNLKKGAI